VTGDPRLVCLGNFTVDDVILPGGSERPGCIGGDALYAGLAARLFEPLTEIAAPIGSDLPEPVRQALAEAGFSAAALPVRPLPTLRNRVVYGADGSRVWTLYASEAEFEALSPAPADLPESYRRTPSFLILAMALSAQERLLDWMRAETNARIALDPQEDYIAGNVARIEAMLAKVDIFMPSAEEVRLLTGGEDWRAAARHFAARGPRIVVVKLGAEGVIVHDAERDLFTSVPAYPAAPVDTTGAGDAFCGGFAAAMLSDRADLARAAHYGAVAASFAIADYGASGILAATTAEAQRRLSEWLPANLKTDD
jgi:sugar/nucleoside kinase (ribokinase family)